MASGGAKTWFGAQELADLGLPGLPRTKRKINELAQAERWVHRTDAAGQPMARPRAGRGGGLEYHISLLRPAAVTELIRRGLVLPVSPANDGPDEPAPPPKDQVWAWFDAQSDKVKAETRRRLEAIVGVELIEGGGASRTEAVQTVAAKYGVSPPTIWNWLRLVQGVAPLDRLPRLAPVRKGGGVEAEVDPELFRLFKSDFLRLSKPSYASCYERLRPLAAARGLTLPCPKTLQRKLERETDPRVIVAMREGGEALRRLLPPQQRSVKELHALELVNIDGHKWDVFVRWPDGHIGRPMMVAIQDVYSRKFLAWRIGQTENTTLTRLAFADLFRTWGVPDGCLLDNGRAFASKEITGGAKTRFRFKIRPSDPMGLLTGFGVQIHWATPYRGQSKPIERGFRDLCDHGARHPAFEGAYTGNRPDAKPENYGSKAVDLETFVRVVNKVMAAHNARPGRRTEAARGRSFDETFAESYARHPIARATEEQQRMALLAADQVSADRVTGAITLYDNRYWSEALHGLAGERVTVRFDPDDLTQPLHVYRLDGGYVCAAEMQAATGFLDRDSAVARKKLEAEHKRATRKAMELEDLLSAEQLAAMLPDDEPENAAPSPTVIKPARLARTVGAAAARRSALDRLDLEDLAPVAEPRARFRVVE